MKKCKQGNGLNKEIAHAMSPLFLSHCYWVLSSGEIISSSLSRSLFPTTSWGTKMSKWQNVCQDSPSSNVQCPLNTCGITYKRTNVHSFVWKTQTLLQLSCRRLPCNNQQALSCWDLCYTLDWPQIFWELNSACLESCVGWLSDFVVS